jgi:hypothetical protein
MTKNDKQKRFNCVEMKTNIQRQIYTETQNMSVDELLYYFNESARAKVPCNVVINTDNRTVSLRGMKTI